MDVGCDETAGKGLHGIAEDISREGLHYVLGQLSPKRLKPSPVLIALSTLIGDALGAVSVDTDLRFDI